MSFIIVTMLNILRSAKAGLGGGLATPSARYKLGNSAHNFLHSSRLKFMLFQYEIFSRKEISKNT